MATLGVFPTTMHRAAVPPLHFVDDEYNVLPPAAHVRSLACVDVRTEPPWQVCILAWRSLSNTMDGALCARALCLDEAQISLECPRYAHGPS